MDDRGRLSRAVCGTLYPVWLCAVEGTDDFQRVLLDLHPDDDERCISSGQQQQRVSVESGTCFLKNNRAVYGRNFLSAHAAVVFV